MEKSQVKEMDKKDDERRQSDRHSEKNGEEGAKISFKERACILLIIDVSFSVILLI